MSAGAESALDLAASLESAGKLGEAEASYRKFIDEQPAHAVARFNYACFLRRRGRLEEALREHQAALDRRIEQPEEVLSNMAVIHTALRRDDEARLHLEWALSANPGYIPAMYNLGLYHEEFGDRKAALDLFHRILELNPAWHDALVRIAHAETVSDPDGEVVRRLRRALRRSNLEPLTRESLHFALGKALDDCGRYDEAFEQFAFGNRLSESRLAPYDERQIEQGVTRIIGAFDAARIAQATPISDRRLVFVTGMFRSGSTLTEQVLAAHPAVTAGGEIDYLMRVPLSLTPGDWQAVARGYLEYLDRSFPGTGIVTNKRPDAFPLFGMLRAVFPNARFVNTVRDPRDTCLSIWFQQFDSRLGYAADLAHVAHHYRQYRRLMAHWKSLFGECIFDADYDELVRDPRGATSRLLEFLGLEWDERCLEFQKNRARVRTASVSQVREPLYRKSSGRWRNYERHLGRLLRALDEEGTDTSSGFATT
jgi:tetratricopeptide (TPR) repeat protein